MINTRSRLSIVLPLAGTLLLAGAATATAHPHDGTADKADEPRKVYPPNLLSADDIDVLERGAISDETRDLGVLLAVWPGMGIGQAAQGRWTETGWMFTFGELGIITGGVLAVLATDDISPAYVATMALGGVRALGVLDAMRGVDRHNRRVRQLEHRLDSYQPATDGFSVGLTPDRSGAQVGVGFGF